MSCAKKAPDGDPCGCKLRYSYQDMKDISKSCSVCHHHAAYHEIEVPATPQAVPPPVEHGPSCLNLKDPCEYPLLTTYGIQWDFQANASLERIGMFVEANYIAWKNCIRDKTAHTLFSIASGAGTGKSRLLTEFPHLVKSQVKHEELSKRLEASVVFSISFENGTYLVNEEVVDAEIALGTRMAHQLISCGNPEYYKHTFDHHKMNPQEVLSQLAKQRSCEPRDLTVIIVIDGVQKFTDKAGKLSTDIYEVLASLLNVTSAMPFVIACVAATLQEPSNTFFRNSQQKRYDLLVTPLEPPKRNNVDVFDMGDVRQRMLLDDMGGHGRAIEALEVVVRALRSKSDAELDPRAVLDAVVLELVTVYQHQYSISRALLKIIFGRKLVDKNGTVVFIDEAGKQKEISTDALLAMGLIGFVPSKHSPSFGYLVVPYVWVRTWLPEAYHIDHLDDILRANYDEMLRRHEPGTMMGAQASSWYTN
eukprot:Colp12_sorted_trinity150504_noHs@15662